MVDGCIPDIQRTVDFHIRNNIERDLTEMDRSANLKLLAAILFSTKITILVLMTDSECEDCCAESFVQLIKLVKLVRQIKES